LPCLTFYNFVHPGCKDDYPGKILFDEVCMMTLNKNCVKAGLFMTGFLLYDTLDMIFGL